MALLRFHTLFIVIDDSSWKNAAESFTVALTLTLGGYESAIAPRKYQSSQVFKISFNIIWKKIFVTHFPFLTDSLKSHQPLN